MRPHLLIALALSISILCAFSCAGDAHAFPMASGGLYDGRSALVAAIDSVAAGDHVDERELADAIAEASHGSKDWAALLLTVALHESGLSDRIRRNDFRPWEGDAYKSGGIVLHRASGIYQEHLNLNNKDTWGSTDLAVQVASGSRLLKSAYWTCKRLSSGNWIAFTINAYAGKACDARWSGLDARLATFAKIRGRL